MAGKKSTFQKRLEKHHDELRWLYMELYGNDDMFAELCSQMYEYDKQRSQQLKKMDESREKEPDWYKKNDILGMMMYIDNYAGNLKGVKEKLDYLEECQVNYIHLMPFLDTPKGRSDGGYAVSDFRKVQPQLGTMEDLESLTQACHERGMNVCMDFVMNHTSEDHEWAVRARRGEGEYMSRYFFFHDYSIPSQYEKTVPQVFPTTAPGNFTWLQEAGHFVMTTFYPYQWDLNYRNPRVFNEMVYNFLFLANKGIDVMRIDAVPYIWKELGTNCRNLPQVHTIVRMIRMICEVVCPGVLLLGEVVMEPEKVVPYFGTVEKPECHMLYNVTTMASTWHTVATGDTRLLKLQMDIVSRLPKEYVFLNYLRCHDDIGWGLDYGFLKQFGMGEVSHKKYLNDFLTGAIPEAFGRGELYNSDPTSGDARLCGTTASLCGIEKAAYERNDEALAQAVRLDLMLHAYMLTQSGIPVIYSGDEIGQENDYTYHEEPDRWGDSRYLHRGKFRWDLEEKRKEKGSVQEKLFTGIGKLEDIRKSLPVFHTDADVHTIDTQDHAVLGIVRENAGQKLTALFNFSAYEKTVRLEADSSGTELISGEKLEGGEVRIEGYGACWLLEE
ncbi:MAG: Beta-galactosidase C-terminal domain [Eubacterium sp.]|nr:Beta-galactosidase C-terminal domain [Eubacterium sp.]